MASNNPIDAGMDPVRPLTPGWRWLATSAALYLACLTVATWPAVPRIACELPSRVDPLTHIWTMRWNKSCLLQGKLPFRCPDVQYPVGVALGTLPPMHFQTLLYVPLSSVFANDVLCYNLIRTAAFLLSGLGTLVLIWNLLGDRRAAMLGGMLAMLGQPMTFFSQGELEQITVGWFPLFLVAWMRWVDRPSGWGLIATAMLYILVAMSAPYFGVFAVFPAALYIAWRWVSAGRAGLGAWSWLSGRLGWFAAFTAATAPVLIVLFSSQIWATLHGFSMTRPDAEFAMCRVPLWAYFVPSPNHHLSHYLPFSTYVMGEVGSIPAYLGVVTMGLLAYAAISRAPLHRRGFWWAAFAMLFVLSLGAHLRAFGHEMSLPAAWLKRYFIGFRMIRVPARFCLFAGVAAAVLAAAGLHHLLGRLRSGMARNALVLGLGALALLDLSVTPYPTIDVPPMPPCYERIRQIDPHATIADIPQFNGGAFHLPALAAYWQSQHGARTSAGYTAFPNTQQDNLIYYNSPFIAHRLANPEYLHYPERERFELVDDIDFRSYVWLYLKVHDIRFIVFHHTAAAFPELPIRPERFEALLHDSLIYNDAQTAVFDRERMPEPTKPVLLYDRGWNHRVARKGETVVMLRQTGRVVAYNPDPDRPVILTLDVAAHKTSKRLTLAADGVEVARWTVSPAGYAPLASPPLNLSRGLHELILSSDREDKPSRTDANIPGDKTPFSLWAAGIGIEPDGPVAVIGRQVGDGVAR